MPQNPYPDTGRSYSLRWFPADPSIPPVDFADASRFHVFNRIGFGVPQHQAVTLRGLRQDGDTVLGIYAQPRQLEIGVYMLERALPMNVLRQQLADALDPAAEGVLEYRDRQSGLVATLSCRPDGLPMDTQPKERLAHAERIRWVAHDPWWNLPEEIQPIPQDGNPIKVVVGGTVPTIGWVLTLVGPVTNPIFRNVATGEQVQINTYIDPDHTLQITTLYNQKSAVVYPTGQTAQAQTVFLNRQAGSTFWQLQRGDNLVALTGVPATPTVSTEAGVLRYIPRRKGV